MSREAWAPSPRRVTVSASHVETLSCTSRRAAAAASARAARRAASPRSRRRDSAGSRRSSPLAARAGGERGGGRRVTRGRQPPWRWRRRDTRALLGGRAPRRAIFAPNTLFSLLFVRDSTAMRTQRPTRVRKRIPRLMREAAVGARAGARDARDGSEASSRLGHACATPPRAVCGPRRSRRAGRSVSMSRLESAGAHGGRRERAGSRSTAATPKM